MTFNTIVIIIYIIILIFGLVGNCWVINSVIRSRRPRSGSLTPSDRLRTYIGVLAIIDLLVIISLIIRTVYIILPYITINTQNCQIIYIVDHLVKLTSLTCLMCISIERYITIRKPFSSKVRKRFIQLTPLFACCVLALISSGIIALSANIVADSAQINCIKSNESNQTELFIFALNLRVAQWIVAVGFSFQLSIVSFNYSQIVRHVKRKFWQRKARVVANSRVRRQPLIVSEPRYMKDMTAAIVKIAFFHIICWLPYCIMQILPNSIRLKNENNLLLNDYVTTSLRFITEKNYNDGLAWLALISDYLTYVNSAGDWIFYAAMNRDLRSLIRATTERRKRSTMSQQSPPNLHRSLRRQMTLSLRFFYSINSYRSNANSVDESCSTIQNVPFAHIRKNEIIDLSNDLFTQSMIASNNNNHKVSTIPTSSTYTGNSEELYGIRDESAHIYCLPKPLHSAYNSKQFFA